MKQNFFKKKTTTSIFSIIAFISGFLFLDSGITGNAILNDKYNFNLLSLIGTLLIFCSLILALYSFRKK
jgi:hypothetical protein